MMKFCSGPKRESIYSTQSTKIAKSKIDDVDPMKKKIIYYRNSNLFILMLYIVNYCYSSCSTARSSVRYGAKSDWPF